MELHHLAAIFPEMPPEEFSELADDIAKYGLHEPIKLYEGKILDGRHRYRACELTGIEPRFEQYEGEDPVAFVLSKNIRRRHLNPGQHAVLISLLHDWEEQNGRGSVAKMGQARTTLAARAAMSGASERTQSMADAVVRDAPDLAEKVVKGKVRLHKANLEKDRRTDPAKPSPKNKIQKLQAVVSELKESEEAAKMELQAAQEAADLAIQRAKGLEAIANGEHATAFEDLLARNRALQDAVDALNRENTQLKRQVLMLQRDLNRSDR